MKPSVSPPIERTLVVSSYPPRHCGIGAYAHAHAGGLRDRGDEVIVLSPPDGDGDIRVPFSGGRPFFRAARIGSGYDRILVHFQPSLYYRPRAPVSKVLASFGLWWLVVRRPRTELLVHEADPPVRWRPDYVVLRWALRRARLLFHTDAERRELEREYRITARATIVPHTEGIRVQPVTREDARRLLDVAEADPLFVCAGFLHPDKGFERAAQAWAAAGRPGRLVIVGSVRDRTPANLAYERMLRDMAAADDRIELRDGFVPDREFDAWVAAADLVILPYRRSWSSGALARAQRLGTPAAVADVGGLAEQAGPNDVVFRTDAELARVVAERVAARA